jgi:predicted O-methyltransferase YrrM
MAERVATRLIQRAAEALLRRLNAWSERADDFLLHRRLQQAGVAEVASIPTWTAGRELRALYELAAACHPGARALEIGSYLGASTCYLAAGLAGVDGHLFCVDTWHNETMPEGERDTFAEFCENTKGVRDRITAIRKRSDEVGLEIPAPVNLAFIDGDHSYSAVKRDFELVQRLLGEDGVVVFHDCSNSDYEGVTRVIGEAVASGEWMIAGFLRTLLWMRRAKWCPTGRGHP